MRIHANPGNLLQKIESTKNIQIDFKVSAHLKLTRIISQTYFAEDMVNVQIID